MPQGKGTYGSKWGRPKKKMESITIDGDKINFKAGALRSMFKMKKSQKWTKGLMRKLLKKKDGEEVEAFGHRRKMTKLLRKRLNFGLTLMKMD